MKLPKTHQPWNENSHSSELADSIMPPEDNRGCHPTDQDRSSGKAIVVCVALFLLLILLALFLTQCVFNSKPLAGTRLVYRGDLSAQEAKTLANDAMEKSRITVSLAPAPKLSNDGQLAMNFVVNEGNNGFSERFEIEQEGRVIYKSPVVAPGRILQTVDVPQAEIGEATVTVFAVDGGGEDHGNPVSVEIDINE